MSAVKGPKKRTVCRRCGAAESTRPGTLCYACFKAAAQEVTTDERLNAGKVTLQESAEGVQERIWKLLVEVEASAGLTEEAQRWKAESEMRGEMCLRLADRVYLQSELLSRRAERGGEASDSASDHELLGS